MLGQASNKRRIAMIQIIKESSRVTVTNYFIEFHYKDDPYAGYSFPANKDRTLALDKMTPEAIINYEHCKVDNCFTEAEFTTNTYSYTDPAVGKCHCGAEVTLSSRYMGAVQCECGQWYNIFGQELKEQKYWEDDDYE
jgi:hypothetical protein